MAILLPEARQQFTDANGVPLVGGKVFTYMAGSLVAFQTTWQNPQATVANSNPIILDGRGEATIFWDGIYQVQVQDSLGNIIYTVDNVTGNDGGTTRPIVGTAGTNVVTATSVPQLRRYVPGMLFRFRPFGANTGPVTINIDGLGLIDVLAPDGSNLVYGEFQPGVDYMLMMDDGADDLILIGTAATSGTIQCSLTGMTAAVSPTLDWYKFGKTIQMVVTNTTGLVGISNATTMSMTGIPAYLAPELYGGFQASGSGTLVNNNVNRFGINFFSSASVITFQLMEVSGVNMFGNSAGFTAAGLKGLVLGTRFIYRSDL